MLTPNRTSTAYDFDLFDVREKPKQEKPIMEVKEGNLAVAKKGNFFAVILVAVIVVSFPIYILSSKVTLSELSVSISAATTELAAAERENMRLSAELDNIATLARVEEFALAMGMQKITITQGNHITLDTGSTTEVAEIDENPFTRMADWFSVRLEYLGLG
ncbi:MAG: hypothetical protein FWH20_06550 [Oscillospiraceae bacterium]|nr:hypothetical protein [Oscillospiraceae bacterium]